jgi:hypothetical protein
VPLWSGEIMPEAVLLMQDLPHLRTPAIYYSIPARTTFSRKRIIIRILIIIWYQHPQVASGYILVSRVSSRGGRPASHRGCSCVVYWSVLQPTAYRYSRARQAWPRNAAGKNPLPSRDTAPCSRSLLNAWLVAGARHTTW